MARPGNLERMFWLAVIRHAQMEASGEWWKPERPNVWIQRDARRWLTTYGRDILWVGEMAGMTDNMVRKLVEIERTKWIPSK